GLALDLRTAVTKAIKQNIRVRHLGIRIKQNGDSIECNLEVTPFSPPPLTDRFYLVVFEPVGPSNLSQTLGNKAKAKRGLPVESKETAEIAHLREDLASTRESLQAIIE